MPVNDIPDDELLRRAVEAARSTTSRGYQPRWSAVMDTFCLGSTYAWQLCIRFDIDPDQRVRWGTYAPLSPEGNPHG